MRTLNPISLTGIILLLLLSSIVHAGTGHKIRARHHLAVSHSKTSFSAAFEEEATCLYSQIDLENLGLSKKAFEYAYKGYLHLLQHHLLNRNSVLSICDFSQSSRNKRLYIIDLENQKVLINTYVAHGRGSGGEFANSFSNSKRSHKSSLGFYITENTYYGDHGLALKIRGLEKGFNDRAYGRSIVVHGSHYVGNDFLESNPFNGRSFGCPAVPYDETEGIIDAIKDGSCLFIYHPTKKYLTKSKILNS
jgi:L,D-transpeptidase catalytic domain